MNLILFSCSYQNYILLGMFLLEIDSIVSRYELPDEITGTVRQSNLIELNRT